ncbi:MAG: RICIN domain-containing protein, partial [Actinobacteria bacterium]|nr:RICIN domain-containing protein [Actinomycetota bacterium]
PTRSGGLGGQLTMDSSFPGVAMWRPEGKPTQQWNVACDSGAYTLRSVASELYLGSDGDPNEPAMIVKGTAQPFAWKLSTGDDADETTYVLTSAASSEGLVLSMSLLRIFPPLVAILSPNSYSTVEWAFDSV